MKLKSVIISVLILLFEFSNVSAQSVSSGSTNIKLQFGATTPFGLPASSSLIIPKIGIDLNFGQFGLRTSGEFFKTSPEFDVDEYISPISSVITQSNVNEKNGNILLGIAPYLIFKKKTITFQTGIGLKFLLQKGATAIAIYNQTPGTTILNFPNGNANRKLLIIEPNIRASFGKPGSLLRFYLETGYTIPAGGNEYTFTSRNLTNVVDPRGNINIKTLLESKQVTTTEKTLPAFASVGAGIEIKLFSGKEAEKSRYNMPNNYGINDDGIKRSESKEDKKNEQTVAPFKAGSELSKGNPKKTVHKLIALTPKNNANVNDVNELGNFTWKMLGDKVKNPQFIVKVEKLDKNRKTVETFTSSTELTKIPAANLFKTGKIAQGNYQWQVTETTSGTSSGTMFFNSNPCSITANIENVTIECLEYMGSDRRYKICFNSVYQSITGNLTFNNSGSGLQVFDQSHNNLTPSSISPALQPQNGMPLNTLNYCFEVTVPANTSQIIFGLTGDDLNPPFQCKPGPSYAIDSIPSCICNDCDSVNIGYVNKGYTKVNNNTYNLTGTLDVNIPIYGVEFQVVSWEYTATPPSCTNGVNALEQSAMFLLPSTTVNGNIPVACDVSISGNNSNAVKCVKYVSSAPLNDPLFKLTVGLPGALSGLNYNCCVIKYKVCIKATVFLDAEHCNYCSYIDCFEFDNL